MFKAFKTYETSKIFLNSKAFGFFKNFSFMAFFVLINNASPLIPILMVWIFNISFCDFNNLVTFVLLLTFIVSTSTTLYICDISFHNSDDLDIHFLSSSVLDYNF